MLYIDYHAVVTENGYAAKIAYMHALYRETLSFNLVVTVR